MSTFLLSVQWKRQLVSLLLLRESVYKRNFIDSYSSSAQTIKQRVEFRSVPVDGHNVVSFSGRKPDIPCFNGMLRGDVKGCGPRNNDFSDVDGGRSYFGHGDRSVDKRAVHKDLFILFPHITDGYRFQFF